MRLSKRMGVGATLVSLTASLLAVTSPAAASVVTTPPWEPDANAVGTLSFYNAGGQQITSGTNLSHLFDYALGSNDAARPGTTKATVFFGYPDHTKADTTQWISEGASAASTFPDATAPGALSNTGRRPLSHPASSDVNLTAKLGGATLDDTAGYKGIVQIRIKDSGPGIGNGFQSGFWASDVMFDQTAGTWTQVYPAPVVANPTATTTTLAVTPTSPQVTGSDVGLTATVTPSAAGTVQFFDGTTPIGAPVTVASGKASTSTSTLTVGSHSLKATFTPTDATAFQASTSAVSTYVITATPATSTTTTLGVTPPSPQTVGTDVGLTATVTPSAAGTVQFFDGTTAIGGPVTVVGGQASTSTSTLTVGSHSLKATFTPTDATAFGSSTSAVSTYVITGVPATATTTTLAVTPMSPQNYGASVTLTATVAPTAAAGTVQFFDGTTALGAPVTVTNGSATLATSTLTAGSHDLKAVFTPASSAAYTSSTSAVSTFVVTATVPGVPTAVSATPGNASAVVTWTAPTNNGGTAVTGYDVQYSTDGTTFVSAPATTGTATTRTVTGLTNGTSYVFRVAAINAIGTGAYSAPSATVTPATPPATSSAVSIAPATSSVKYNTVIAVSTVVTDTVTKAPVAGVTVQLYRRPNSTTPTAVIATLTTDSHGAARFLVRMTANGQFQYRFAGTADHQAAYSPTISVSAVQGITVARTASTIRSGTVVGFYGEVSPAVSGQTIVLQQRASSGAYSTKATATIQRQTLPNGKTTVGYKVLVRLTGRGTYTFRMYKPATTTLAAGYTGAFGVKVT